MGFGHAATPANFRFFAHFSLPGRVLGGASAPRGRILRVIRVMANFGMTQNGSVSGSAPMSPSCEVDVQVIGDVEGHSWLQNDVVFRRGERVCLLSVKQIV